MSTSQDLPLPPLGLSEEEAQRRFDALQAKLVGMWSSMSAMTDVERTIVVVPSQTTDFDVQGAQMQALEERYLFLLLLLRQPRVRMIYLTSQTIPLNTVDYYLGLMPGVVASHARPRFFNVAPEDRSPRPLSLKLLERPNLIRRIRALIPDADVAHLVPYNTTKLERDLALSLGIPMYAADPKFFHLGAKTGCRRLFIEEGISYPMGREDLSGMDDLVEAVRDMRREKPALEQVMIKLNDGISGEGNAVVTLEDVPSPGAAGEEDAVRARLEAMALEYPGATLDEYLVKFAANGGVVEERIVGEGFASPSVQLRVTPTGEVEILSTHDQLLGGPSGQLYLGARFPADPAYARLISGEAEKVGRRLAREGVLGRFAVDFVVVRRKDGEWVSYAIEVNLRKGGTTHPFLTLEYLTDGTYDPATATFRAPSGREKHYVAGDHMASPLYRVFTPDDLIDITVRRGLHFDQARQTGVVFHMLATLAENGQVGATAVGDSRAEAEELYQEIQNVLDKEAKEALEPVQLPDRN